MTATKIVTGRFRDHKFSTDPRCVEARLRRIFVDRRDRRRRRARLPLNRSPLADSGLETCRTEIAGYGVCSGDGIDGGGSEGGGGGAALGSSLSGMASSSG
jgi:hypothetical protein